MRQPGEWIHGKYQVERVLGSGGMGVVYATKRRNESRAAVKVLHPRFARDKTVRARFVEEGYLANRVGHPAVVTIIEDDIDESGNFYLVMEHLDGVDLGRFLGSESAPLSIAQALNITDQLLAALVQAHQKGIVHRDIKPANLMILRDGRLKLLDFGIAQALGGDLGVCVDDDDDEEGEILGTDRYMAPEQGNGFFDAIDARTDLWAVGALLMALLAEEETAAVPLWDQSYEERAWSFSCLGEKVPPHVVQIISLALQPQKSRRWASAATMKGAVEAAHLDLFGPMSRDALASMALAKLGPSPFGATEADGQEVEAPVPLDPTAVSRRSSIPSRARSSSVPELSDPQSEAGVLRTSSPPGSASEFTTGEPASLPVASGRSSGFAVIAFSVVLLIVSGLWFLTSEPSSEDVPPALGTAQATQESDFPSTNINELREAQDSGLRQADPSIEATQPKSAEAVEVGPAIKSDPSPKIDRTPKSNQRTDAAPSSTPLPSSRPESPLLSSKQEAGVKDESAADKQGGDSSPKEASPKRSPGGLDDIFKVQKKH